MNEEDSSDIDAWIEAQQRATPPALPPDFADTILERITESKALPETKNRFPVYLMRAAAVVAAGAVGLLRIELILHLLILST